MSETPPVYNVGLPRSALRSSATLSQPRPSFESQLQTLPPDVRSVAESLALRDLESAKRYVAQYLAANRGLRS